MPKREIHHMRESYESSFLLEEHCFANPFHQFDQWFHQALEAKISEPNAMTLATAGRDRQPSARIVLLKSFSEEGFIFYTNYESHKGQQMQDNAKVALLFWWQERQVRVEGTVQKTDRQSAEKYFHSRPKGSQIGAVISKQSSVLENRFILEDRFKELEQTYHGKEVPLPDYWGGYLVVPHIIEFWQGRVSRLHDRIRYTREAENAWRMERLAP